MRKFIFILFIQVITLPQLAHSQILLTGPKLGVQVSRPEYENKSNHDYYKRNPGIGWHAGMVMNFKVSKLFSLHTELLFSNITRSVAAKAEDDITRQVEQYKFITAPVMLRTSFHHGYNEYYFNIGPDLSYWLGGKGRLQLEELEEFSISELEYKIYPGLKGNRDINNQRASSPNQLQLGLDMGIGAVFPMQRQSLMVDLRYTWGHSNMGKEDNQYLDFVEFSDDMRFANQTLSLSVAYLFSFDYLQARRGKSINKNK